MENDIYRYVELNNMKLCVNIDLKITQYIILRGGEGKLVVFGVYKFCVIQTNSIV